MVPGFRLAGLQKPLTPDAQPRKAEAGILGGRSPLQSLTNMSRDFARLSREGFARPRRDGEAMSVETIGAANGQAPGRT